MTRRGRSHLVIFAVLLALLMVGTSVAPVSAAAQRYKVTEKFAMKLVNCVRTGGKITVAGKCKGWGTGKYSKHRTPLKLSRKISDKVAWPWAKRTAVANICGHSLAGSTIDKRFNSAGFKKGDNAENIGCSSAWSPRRMVITVLRWWQDEKAYNGWHWRQLKDPDFKVAGIGVAKLGNGRSRLVVNFYSIKVA